MNPENPPAQLQQPTPPVTPVMPTAPTGGVTEVAPQPVVSSPSEPTKKRSLLKILLTIVLILVALGIAAYAGMMIFMPQQLNNLLGAVKPTPTLVPTPISPITPSPSEEFKIEEFDTSSKRYTNNKYGFELIIPNDREVHTQNTDIHIDKSTNGQPTGPGNSSSIYISVIPDSYQEGQQLIYNYDRKEAEMLLNMKIGQTLATRNTDDPKYAIFWTYTRRPDQDISGIPGKVFFNNKVWEGTQGMTEKRIYVKNKSHLYMIGGYFVPSDISESEFDQIVQSFKFVNSAFRTPSNEQVFCTADAKLCADGSSVGRIPPNCEFAACPGE